jgi:hypothetical protein
MRRWFAEVWCASCVGTIDELFPEDGLAHGLGPGPVRGPEAFKAFHAEFCRTFRDIHIDVVDAIDEGDRCYVRAVATMTFQGRRVTLTGGCLSRVVDGRIAETWNEWDFLGLLVGMQALPADIVPQAFAGQRVQVVAAAD